MKERYLFVDNLRGVLILIVILGHCLQYTGCNMQENVLYNAIQSFQMPLFMFVSGFVSTKDSYSQEWLAKRYKRLLIPFVVGTFIMSLTVREGSMLEYFLYPLKGLWFLWVLAVLSFAQFIIFFLSAKWNNEQKGFFVCTLFVFLVISLLSYVFKGLLCFDLIAFHFLFYFTGYYFNRFWPTIKSAPKRIVVLLFLVSVFLSLSFNKNVPDYFFIKNFSVYVRVVSFIITISLFVMSWVCIDKKSRILNYIGNNTLGIYFIHRVLFEFRPNSMELGLLYGYYPLGVITLFVLMTCVSLLLVELFSRNKIMSFLFLGK